MNKRIFSTAATAATLALAIAIAPTAYGEGEPVFSLAWSEYPSWSVFGVLDESGLIDGDVGKLGPIEKKWGVDIDLKEADYDPCITLYAAGQVDAVCITNMDILSPSFSIAGAAILPTSTSFGADACIVTKNITDVKQLKGKKIRGLELSVSEYTWVRNLELLGERARDYNFANMDPGAAALAVQQKQAGVEAIVVWNPFVLDTLNKNKDTRVLFDSTTIPNEIIDMVVVAQGSLDKPGGANFAHAIIDAFYTINQQIADPATRDETLISIGEKFSDLDLQSMRKVVQQTKFYGTAEEGIALFNGDTLKSTMGKVVEFCVEYEIVDEMPKVGYGAKSAAGSARLRFDPTYMKSYSQK